MPRFLLTFWLQCFCALEVHLEKGNICAEIGFCFLQRSRREFKVFPYFLLEIWRPLRNCWEFRDLHCSETSLIDLGLELGAETDICIFYYLTLLQN